MKKFFFNYLIKILINVLIIMELSQSWVSSNGVDNILSNDGLIDTKSIRASTYFPKSTIVVSHTKKNHKHRKNSKNNKLSNNKRISHRNTLRGDDSESVISQIQSINVTGKVGESVFLRCMINSSYGSNPGVIFFFID